MEQVKKEKSQTRLNESLAQLADEQQETEKARREEYIQKMKMYSQIIEVLKVKISTQKHFWRNFKKTHFCQLFFEGGRREKGRNLIFFFNFICNCNLNF